MLLLTTDVVNDDDYDATEIGYSIVWWFINKLRLFIVNADDHCLR